MKINLATNYKDLRKQAQAMKTLLLSIQSRISELEKKDYSYRESQLKTLEEALESERDMNNKLTIELAKYEN